MKSFPFRGSRKETPRELRLGFADEESEDEESEDGESLLKDLEKKFLMPLKGAVSPIDCDTEGGRGVGGGAGGLCGLRDISMGQKALKRR